MKHPFSAEEAVRALLDLSVTPKAERLALFSAFGRILSESVTARIDVPSFSKSPYDGYALRSEDTASASPEQPVVLTITEELPAGTAPRFPVTPGTAAKILTGAAVPQGADAIIKYEETAAYTAQSVTFHAPCPAGNIVAAGEDVRSGSLLCRQGEVLSGALMGVLAGQGIAEVSVYHRPVVSVVSTGSELATVGTPLSPGKIYSTNFFTIGGLVRELGGDVRDGGLVDDDPQALAQRLARELKRSDLVITTGGASVGDYDYTEDAFLRLGGQILFKKLSFKPGGSMVCAVRDGKVLLGLSGNPGAAAVGLLRVGAPYLRRLCGRNDPEAEILEVLLKKPLEKPSPKTRFLRGHLEIIEHQAYFAENSGQGNGSVSSLIRCDLLAEIPAGSPPLAAGTPVKAYRVNV